MLIAVGKPVFVDSPGGPRGRRVVEKLVGFHAINIAPLPGLCGQAAPVRLQIALFLPLSSDFSFFTSLF